MGRSVFERITKEHSTTFYYATLFFPRRIREDVCALYAFLRTADDIVDEERSRKAFDRFKKQVYFSIKNNGVANNEIIDSFSRIFRKYDFDISYLDSFFSALESDFSRPLRVLTRKSLRAYIYGVAGVVGLMMAKIIGLPRSSFGAAAEFGELMQLVNIIRDIKEDYSRGRVYIPKEDIDKHGLLDILYRGSQDEKKFESLIRSEVGWVLDRMERLSEDIERVGWIYRRPIRISRDVYKSIANKIYKRPTLVWGSRVRVSKFELMVIILRNLV